VGVIGKVLGNLKIISKIGQGGMGVVYLAEHLTLKKKFAVKCLTAAMTEDPGFRERFYQEAVNHASLDHPNIVHATDFFEEDGEFFFVMEYIKGQGLDELIQKPVKQTEKEILQIFKGILSGLNFAHSKGVIHRDIKPSNVIIDESGRSRITDFGIAILVGDKRLTKTGSNVGSAWYMSPEQIVHPREIDHRSDVYSAGIVLYEMLTGDVPFDGETEYSVKNKHVNEKVPDPTNINPKIIPQLKKLIFKALEKNPDDRFSGCGEFLKEIEDYEKELEKQREEDSHPISLWVFTTVAVLITAMVVAFLIIPNNGDKDTLPIPIDNTGRHEAAYIWIEGAAEKASMICTEIKEMELLQNRRQIGLKTFGNTAELDVLNKRIKDHENNINELIQRYRDFMNKLSQIDSEIVADELNNYSNMLAKKELYQRINVIGIVDQHYQESLNEENEINIRVMSELCS
jgi:serine/threonine protein kinase